ncbi:ABC transporter ATP-binding protein, partial [Streptomyces sp. NPDC058548]
KGQTTVLITHRLASARHADVIYVLDEGRVAEQGTFAELMDPTNGTGAFREAYELQARQFVQPAVQPTVPAQPVRSTETPRTPGTQGAPGGRADGGEATS